MKPKILRIYSENSDFQYIETLRRNRVKRHHHREFFVEGVRSINQAIKYRWQINALIYSNDQPLSDWAKGVLHSSRAGRYVELPDGLFQKLSEKTDRSELIALIEMPPDELSRIPIHDRLLVLIFDRPASPGNLGTLIRSCDALGADGLIITGHAVDLYDPETIRAATGSLFALPTVRLPSYKELLPWLAATRDTLGALQVIGTSAKATKALDDQEFLAPTALVVGNETWGLSANYRALCDQLISIPISGSASSLNVACAASIMLYAIAHQRNKRWPKGGPSFQTTTST